MTQKLTKTINKYYNNASDPDSRFRSWDHCHKFFRKNYNNLHQVEDKAALCLGFYLASWGMYRGSGFLLQHAYTIHKPVIRELASSNEFLELWKHDVGADRSHTDLVQTIMKLVDLLHNAYDGYEKKPTDTLISKALLGTVGCLPACDTLFKKGFRNQGYSYGSLNKKFIHCIIDFCIKHKKELDKIQPTILDLDGHPYPRMKLVDMHFWQIGNDL